MVDIVILNAPPGVGKDCLADYCIENDWLFKKEMFKGSLFDAACEHYKITREQLDAVYTRDLKEAESDLFGGLSPRQAMIHVSEYVYKPKYGKTYFGDKLSQRLGAAATYSHILTDGGFEEEIQALVNKLGADRIAVIRIYRDGFTFEGDSRSYFTDEFLSGVGVQCYDLYNDSLDEFLEEGYDLISGLVRPF